MCGGDLSNKRVSVIFQLNPCVNLDKLPPTAGRGKRTTTAALAQVDLRLPELEKHTKHGFEGNIAAIPRRGLPLRKCRRWYRHAECGHKFAQGLPGRALRDEASRALCRR